MIEYNLLPAYKRIRESEFMRLFDGPVASLFLGGTRKAVVLRAILMIAVIAYADWRIESEVTFGFLYLFPMLFVGSVMNRWQIAIAGALCTFLTEIFDTLPWTLAIGLPRDGLIFAAFAGMGLLVHEFVRGRRAELLYMHQIESESQARKAAEEQLKILVESSPIAIFTADSEGRVLVANDAVHRLLSIEPGTLPGRPIRDYLPSLVNVHTPDQDAPSFRTVMQCRGKRENGEVFFADVWFSTYWTSAGPRLAAIVIDTSEELRTREESSLHQVLAASRIVVTAVSHEVRNLCGAISMVQEHLARDGLLSQNKDFEALQTLVRALESIAATNLQETAQHATGIEIHGLLDELRIVIDQSLREANIKTTWNADPELPLVWAERNSLLQVFLNLTKNAERAMLYRQRRELDICAQAEGKRISIRFQDTGGGVVNPERLFRPFQEGSQATGLGLYLSRALLRSFKGDLRYEPVQEGSLFIVELSPVVSTHVDESCEPKLTQSTRS
ncbi:MAG TPA: PAS domain-containing sensor histidine kinase [Acidobacteriota bacterium]|nr:PAS domain-containing sensor histidine kinase [Acidobacteriota bacterium]